MIAAIQRDHPVRVGIDGVDASGKTVLADELIKPLRDRRRSVIRVSVDGFHHPREIRHRRGRGSPQGYYFDSFDYNAIVSNVLEPLGPGGTLKYRSAVFDFRADSPVHIPPKNANPDAVLLFEGVFLHRPELRPYWDFSVFVHADFDITLERAQKRDLPLFGTAEKVQEAYRQRYIPGQKIYLDTESPSDRANVIWNNNDPENPGMTVNRWVGKAPG